MAITNDPFVMSSSRRWGFNDTLIPTGIPFKETRFFKHQHEDLYKIFPGSEVEFNWHKYGIYISAYEKYPELASFFRIISIDEVPDSPPIVATVEAYDYPIYAVQYHPEKNLFDFLHPSIPHTRRGQQFTEDLAFFFVSEAKKNQHRFASYEEEVALHMSNYPRYFGLFEHNGDNVFIDYYIFE